jgi:hypothetical protein
VEFNDAQPNSLLYVVQGQPPQRLIRAMPYLYDECNADERLGALHAEGLSESWANIYLKFDLALDAKNRGDDKLLSTLVYPDIEAGINGIRWVEACVRSADSDGMWVPFGEDE